MDRTWLQKSLDSKEVDILEWRRHDLSLGTSVRLHLSSGRQHPKTKASNFLRQSGQSADDTPPADIMNGLKTSSSQYGHAITKLDDLVDGLGSTVVSQVVVRTRELLDAVQAAMASRVSLQSAVDRWSEWKVEHAAARAATRRRTGFKVVQYLKPFQQGGVPAHVAKHMHFLGMFPRPEGVSALDWPEYGDSTIGAVSDLSGEDSLKHSSAWEQPVLLDLATSGQFETGSLFWKSGLLFFSGTLTPIRHETPPLYGPVPTQGD